MRKTGQQTLRELGKNDRDLDAMKEVAKTIVEMN